MIVVRIRDGPSVPAGGSDRGGTEMKRAIQWTTAAILALVLALSACGCLADQRAGDYSYKVLKDGTAEITGYTGKAKKVTVPASLDGIPVTSIGEGAFSRSSITRADVPDGVVSIGDRAFHDCKALTRVTLPDSVETIGKRAFASCKKLKKIILPESLSEMGEAVFSGCESLTAVTFPKGIETVPKQTFAFCKNLTKVKLPRTVKELGVACFYCCTGLVSVKVPKGVTTLAESVFYGCRNLSELSLPSTLKSIGASAFTECGSLARLVIPKSVKEISHLAFRNPGANFDNVPMETITLVVVPGGYAEKYCRENSLKYEYPEK